jgi:hypothetical protein
MSDNRPTPPSLQSRRERIHADVAARNLEPAAVALADLFEERAREHEAIDRLRYVNEEKAVRKARIDAAFDPQFDAAEREAIAARTRTLDQEEGTLRREATSIDVSGAIAAKAQLFVQQVASAADPRAIFEDATFAGHPDLIRTVGYAVLARLKALAAKDRSLPTSPRHVAYATFEHEFAVWERQHPTVRQRLAAIERERANIATKIRMTSDYVRSLYGLRRPAAPLPLRPVPEVGPSSGSLQVGPAFDRLDVARDVMTRTRGRR